VGYWENVLSFPTGINQGPPNVNLPKPWSRELRRIRLHDLVDTDTIFFVVSELQEVSPSQRVEFLEREGLYNDLDLVFSHTQLVL
jgi:polysaccharide pyruvyl transferase WcaK-like protein